MASAQQYQQAVNYALSILEKDYDVAELVDGVRCYFNDNNIEYDTFSNRDLEPFVSLSE